MSQFSPGNINPITTGGASLASVLNQWREALHSGHSGPTRPAYAVAGMVWVKTVSAALHELYYHDGVSDVLLVSVNPTTHQIIPVSQALAEAGDSEVPGWWSPKRIFQAFTKFISDWWVAKKVLSGTWTPTLTNQLNVSSSTAFLCQYSRVSDGFVISGQVSMTPTAAGADTQLFMSIPFMDATIAGTGWAGGGFFSVANDSQANFGVIVGISGAAQIVLRFIPTVAASRTFSFYCHCRSK